MYRSLVSILVLCVFVSACTTSPSVAKSSNIVKYGAGSLDDDSPSTANKAAASGGFQRIRQEEALARYNARSAELDAALAVGDYAGAMTAYDAISDLLTGVSAGASRLQDARARMDRALDAIVVETVSVPAETIAGTAFKKDFSAKFSVKVLEVKKPLAGFACTVFYPAIAADGSKTVLTMNLTTGADGLVAFTAPVPSVPGKNNLVISAALTSRDTVLRDSINHRKDAGQLAVAFLHLAGSNNRRIPTTISILDFDKNGKPVLSGNPSATTLLKPLVQKGFVRIGMADFPKELTSGDEEALIKAAKAQFGSGVERFIYGASRVVSVTQGDDKNWTCTMTAQISVWDFVTGTKVRSIDLSQTCTGKTEYAAIEAARAKLCGESLVNDLYYNL